MTWFDSGDGRLALDVTQLNGLVYFADGRIEKVISFIVIIHGRLEFNTETGKYIYEKSTLRCKVYRDDDYADVDILRIDFATKGDLKLTLSFP